jgi:hypothetical protein
MLDSLVLGQSTLVSLGFLTKRCDSLLKSLDMVLGLLDFLVFLQKFILEGFYLQPLFLEFLYIKFFLL